MSAALRQDHGDIAGFVVHDRETGAIVHHEVFDAGLIPENELADRMIRRWEELVRAHPIPRYDVEYGLFPSVAAFYREFPACRPAQNSPS